MAETIAAHMLAAGPAGVLAAAPAYRAEPPAVFEDEEYLFPSGAANGAKCCTKCGATKTPQWREGPVGERGGGA